MRESKGVVFIQGFKKKCRDVNNCYDLLKYINRLTNICVNVKTGGGLL